MDINLADLPITNTKDITEEFIDIMGHMNVMWYIHLFDYATRNLFASFGLGADYIERTGMGSFALESHIRYLVEVRLGELVTVRSRLMDRGDKTLHFMHFMVRERDAALSATIEVVGAHSDLTKRTIAPFTPEILEKLDPLLAAHQSLPWEAPVCGCMGVRRE